MLFGDINIYFMLFFLLILSIAINVSNSLHLLLTAEMLWIMLYVVVLNVGFLFDNINLLSLTFFFLVLSAVEFGIGLVIMLVQNIFLRSLQLTDNSKNWLRYNHKFLIKLKNFKLPWV